MGKRNILFRLLVGIGFAAALAGCQYVPINTGVQSPPTVVIEVQLADNQYHPQSSVTYLGSPIYVKADANDPQG